MYLAIDTSTEIASIALAREGEVLAELTWRSGQNHSVELLPNLEHLLAQAGLTIEAALGIIVARGPGSFNGLRVGISTAKGLAFSRGIPIVGLSTLEVAAYPHALTGRPVRPIFNAGRGEIATATYQQQGDRWQTLEPEHLTVIDRLCAEIATPTVFCGEPGPAIIDELNQRLGGRAVIPPPAARLRRAAFLAELGYRRLQTGPPDDPTTLQPLYLRRPSITRPRPDKDWRPR
ncbi:MAG: tRNA (adenosine(37)-N6)-threonylcarbamoyltransferase complex dimerization subunit type 1 TsaB [Chloroflexota bacterium]